MSKAEPIVTQIIDRRITAAKCSDCGEPLDMPNEVGSVEDQKLAIDAAFAQHMTAKHSR
jgi:hypothetical protein